MLSDIKDRKDVKKLIDNFYQRVRRDDVIGAVFSHVNWTEHLPVMYNFWSSLIFGEQSYKGNPLPRHIGLQIDSVHFDRWLKLFIETVDDNFQGESAE